MHADADDEARIAQQRILQLPKPNQLRLALGPFAPTARLPVSLVQHHLLAVMRPAFDVRIRADQLANLRRKLRPPQELHVVPGIRLMHAGRNDRAHVEGGHVLRNVLAASSLASGSVTLKYAFVECVSNGPGGSIEACVVARMNGGVSSSVGCTSLGIVMMWCVRMKPISESNVS